MESLSPCTAEEKRVCVLSGCDQISCTHRMQLSPSQEWQFISEHCRDRVSQSLTLGLIKCGMHTSALTAQIAAVCDFHMYIGHIQKGILKQDGKCSMMHCILMIFRFLSSLPALLAGQPAEGTDEPESTDFTAS